MSTDRVRRMVERVVRGETAQKVTERVTGYTVAQDPDEIGVDLVAIASDNTHVLGQYLDKFRKKDVSGELLTAYEHGRLAITDVLNALKKLQSVGDQIQRAASHQGNQD